jgi:hypothetical protein
LVSTNGKSQRWENGLKNSPLRKVCADPQSAEQVVRGDEFEERQKH